MTVEEEVEIERKCAHLLNGLVELTPEVPRSRWTAAFGSVFVCLLMDQVSSKEEFSACMDKIKNDCLEELWDSDDN